MGYPRSLLVDAAEPGTYHCVSRCVRRAFLCGEDAVSGRNFDHRKQWLEDRVLALAGIFSVAVLAYAVMSNHLHVVLQVDPIGPLGWEDVDVAERWVRLHPVTRDGEIDPEGCRRRVAALAANADRLAVLRQRLGSLSWFMRCISEPLARTANREDGCTGRFWEGRFKCQALLDDAAILACMTYVDLNPVRAGIAPDLAGSSHTSIHRRLINAAPQDRGKPLVAVAGDAPWQCHAVTLAAYIALVDWAGRQLHPGKRGVISESAPSALHRLAPERDWLLQVRGIESRYWRAVGSLTALQAMAKALGQCWLKSRRQIEPRLV